MDLRVTTVGVSETAADLLKMGDMASDAVEDALDRGGKWVRYHARDILRTQIRGMYLRHYPRSITSETEKSAGMVSMIVGPQSNRRQGGMGPGVELGSVNTGPKPHLFKAFDDRVESIIDRAARNVARWPGEAAPSEPEPPE